MGVDSGNECVRCLLRCRRHLQRIVAFLGRRPGPPRAWCVVNASGSRLKALLRLLVHVFKVSLLIIIVRCCAEDVTLSSSPHLFFSVLSSLFIPLSRL